MYTSLRVAGDSGTLPGKWFKTELPLLLDQIRMLVATSSLQSDKITIEQKVRKAVATLPAIYET